MRKLILTTALIAALPVLAVAQTSGGAANKGPALDQQTTPSGGNPGTNGGVVGGATAGAIGGALVGGPIGAVVGGAAGAVIGGTLGSTQQQQLNTYVVQRNTPSYAYSGTLEPGAVLPESGVTYYELPPDYNAPQYRYSVINKRTVIIDPATRRVVQIIN